jgi:hypothetical protein
LGTLHWPGFLNRGRSGFARAGIGTMPATIEDFIHLDTVSKDDAPAVAAAGGQGVNRALKAIEGVALSANRDFE